MPNANASLSFNPPLVGDKATAQNKFDGYYVRATKCVLVDLGYVELQR